MLIITRRPGEKIMLGDDVVVEVIEVSGSNVRIGIEAPGRSRCTARRSGRRSRRRTRPRPPSDVDQLPTGLPPSSSSPHSTSSKEERTTPMSLRIQQQRRGVQRAPAARRDVGASCRRRWSASRSGYRINRAADDAAGLAISESMRAQIRGLAQAQRNAQDGISLVQTAEGSLNEVHAMLQRVRELAVQFKNGTLGDRRPDRDPVRGQPARSRRSSASAPGAEFNGIKLLNAARHDDVPGRRQRRRDHLGVSTISLSALGRRDGVRAHRSATNADLAEIDAAIDGRSAPQRANFGAVQNRLEHTLSTTSAPTRRTCVAAESRIRDVDMAEEMVN